jgi:3-oxoadipate enol-lactonase
MNLTVNGISVNYTLEGPASGPVITMSNSLASNLSMWNPQIPVLASRYRVLRYDTRGHGGTDAPTGPYSLEDLTEDVHALLQCCAIP